MPTQLKLEANFADADAFYAELIRRHEGLSDAQSQAFNARLVLVLANQVGDQQVLMQALDLAARQPGAS